jgi:hypothetical protein
VLDEVFLRVSKFFPILEILSQIDLLSSPEGSLLVLVHLPHVVVSDGEKYEAVGVFLKKRLRKRLLSLSKVLRELLRLQDLLLRHHLLRRVEHLLRRLLREVHLLHRLLVLRVVALLRVVLL